MSKVNENREGYKPTKLGWIPVEWENKKIGDLGSFFSGGTPTSTNKSYYNGTIPFIKSGEINSSTTVQFITDEAFSNSSAKMVEKGDLLYALYGATSGEVGISKMSGAINQAIFCIRSKEHIEYLYYFLLYSKRIILSTFLQGGQGNLSGGIIKDILIPLPPLPEQKKIAQILSTWDEAITTTENLIEKLKTRKKGLMQQLLTGKTRLKGFSGEWESVKLRTVISRFIVPMRDKPKNLNGIIPWCRIEDFEGKYLLKSKTNQGVSIETIKNMNLKVYPVNTLLVSCSANLGKCAIVKTKLITNQTFIGLVPIENIIDVEFLYYLMISLELELNRLSSGTTISYLSRKEFEEFKIIIPEADEQKAIAEILTTADEEINKYEKYLSELQTQKKGLMQKLLTGEVRVKINKEIE